MTYETLIKIDLTDDDDKRARDIENGIAYAALVLMDEYGRSAEDVERLLEEVVERVYDEQYLRRREEL